MSALERVFFPLPEFRRDPVSLLLWWEQRRPLYNLLVGATGICTLGVLGLTALLPPHPALFRIPWIGVAAYALLANACYSAGWLAELLLKRLLPDREPILGPALFRQGLIFSMGLTALPMLLGVGAWGVRVVIWLGSL